MIKSKNAAAVAVKGVNHSIERDSESGVEHHGNISNQNELKIADNGAHRREIMDYDQ